MRILVAMSGGVDSAVAAAILAEGGNDVVGATMKLWGGSGDSGCCSISDVTDARRVADRLGIDHRVFNFTEEFDRAVVDAYVEDHRTGRTPNPCVVCNNELKFGVFLERARRLGFDAIATGHHARIVRRDDGTTDLSRGTDRDKDQSYVLSGLDQAALGSLLLPVGELHKSQVRAIAAERGLAVATKPDSQDVCFIASRTPGLGRSAFLSERIELHQGVVVDDGGVPVGQIPAVELVTLGQRRGLGSDIEGERRYAIDVDVARRQVTVGPPERLLTDAVALTGRTWTREPLTPGDAIEVQISAHGAPIAATVTHDGIAYREASRRVAPGQIVASYRGDVVVGSGVAT
ncbi:MAG TPA: tRNA 2-thiouridine(34) synthase MnmA [Acidimicrobiales bacterium]|nr:tRNA 2-thiouridine(34) synthase MnmA [Acidimicrobiales bacterium]